MKKIFILFLIGFSHLYFSQTIEEETTENTCKCIDLKLQETGVISKDGINKCIRKSLDEVLKSKSEREAKKYMKNMNVFVGKMRKIYQSISEKCLQNNNIKNKKIPKLTLGDFYLF